MPGMMDTVLNLGLNDHVVAGLAHRSGERFAYDSYRRFLDMFGNVVRIITYILFFVFYKYLYILVYLLIYLLVLFHVSVVYIHVILFSFLNR
jgi:hypothetical protein